MGRIIVREPKLILPRRFSPPKKQRGNFAMFPAGIVSAGGAGFNYSLEDFSQTGTAAEGDDCDINVRFYKDGRVEVNYQTNVSGSPIGSSFKTDWSDDPSEDGVGWYIRLVSLDSGSDYYNDSPSAGPPSSWHQISDAAGSFLQFTFTDPNTSGPYSHATSWTFGLSDDGGTSTYDTCTANLTFANEGP